MHYYEREIVAILCWIVAFLFLAKSVVTRRDRGQMRELLGLPYDKVKRFRNFYRQRLERVVAFVFFLFGAGIKLYVLVRTAQKEAKLADPLVDNDPRLALGQITVYLGLAVVVCAAIIAFLHWLNTLLSRRIFLENLAYLMVRQRYALTEDPELMKQIGGILGVQREENDTVESYTARLEAALKLDEIRARLLARGKLPDLD